MGRIDATARRHVQYYLEATIVVPIPPDPVLRINGVIPVGLRTRPVAAKRQVHVPREGLPLSRAVGIAVEVVVFMAAVPVAGHRASGEHVPPSANRQRIRRWFGRGLAQ